MMKKLIVVPSTKRKYAKTLFTSNNVITVPISFGTNLDGNSLGFDLRPGVSNVRVKKIICTARLRLAGGAGELLQSGTGLKCVLQNIYDPSNIYQDQSSPAASSNTAYVITNDQTGVDLLLTPTGTGVYSINPSWEYSGPSNYPVGSTIQLYMYVEWEMNL